MSMTGQLKTFSGSELIFDEEETRQILKFFFPNDKAGIDSMAIDNTVRNFAQGLLVEAVDASYAMGYLDVICQSILSFIVSRKLTKSPVDFMKTLAKKAAKHWFKHATQNDLMHAQIYDSIRSQLAFNCKSYLDFLINGVAKVKGRSSFVATKPRSYIKNNHEISWG